MNESKLTELARGLASKITENAEYWFNHRVGTPGDIRAFQQSVEHCIAPALQSLNAEHEKQVKELEADRDQLVQLCLQRLALGRRLDWLAENAVVFASEEPALELVIPADRYAQQQQQAQQRLSSNLPKLAREVIDAAMKAELAAAKGVK